MININKFSKPLFVFAILLIFSCKDKMHDQILEEQQKAQDSINKTIEHLTAKIPNNKFETIRYEGCEYLLYKEQPDNNKALGFMAHKGNCSNPIHNTFSN